MKIAILGNGGFGTALAIVAHSSAHAVAMWGHDPDYTEELARSRNNTRYLPDVTIPDEVLISADPKRVLDDAAVVLMAVPTQHVRGVMSGLKTDIPRDAPVISLAIFDSEG